MSSETVLAVLIIIDVPNAEILPFCHTAEDVCTWLAISSLPAVLKTRVLSYFYFYGDYLLGCSRQADLLGHRKGHVPRASDLSAPSVYHKEEETQNVLGDDTAVLLDPFSLQVWGSYGN